MGAGSRRSGCWPTHSWAWLKPKEEWIKSLSRVFSFESHSPSSPPFPFVKKRVQLGTLSLIGRHLFSTLPVHKFMIALLDAKHQDICFSACGVLLNLTVDKDKRVILKEGGGIKK